MDSACGRCAHLPLEKYHVECKDDDVNEDSILMLTDKVVVDDFTH